MAFTGQVSTQAPQSMQVSASIARLFPCSLMAFTGQESSHAAQLVQSSVIVWDTVSPPCKISLPVGKRIIYIRSSGCCPARIHDQSAEDFTKCVEFRATLLYI